MVFGGLNSDLAVLYQAMAVDKDAWVDVGQSNETAGDVIAVAVAILASVPPALSCPETQRSVQYHRTWVQRHYL